MLLLIEALKELNFELHLGLLQILVVKTLHRTLDMKCRTLRTYTIPAARVPPVSENKSQKSQKQSP